MRNFHPPHDTRCHRASSGLRAIQLRARPSATRRRRRRPAVGVAVAPAVGVAVATYRGRGETCASLVCMEDLNALADAAVKNSCVQYSTDEETCLKAYMTRQDGTYSPCEYSLVDSNTGEPRYKPNDDPPYDTRCHASREVKLTCDPAPSATQCDGAAAAAVAAVPPPSASPSPPPSPAVAAAALGVAVAAALGVAVAPAGATCGRSRPRRATRRSCRPPRRRRPRRRRRRRRRHATISLAAR